MAARRLVIVMLVLLFVSTLAAALVPAPETGDPETTRTAKTTKEPPAREVVTTIDADARRKRTIRIATGDRLALTVRSPRADQVRIEGLGQLEDVAPLSPARFDLVPIGPGKYPIRLLGAEREIGRIVVAKRAAAGKQSDEPRLQLPRAALRIVSSGGSSPVQIRSAAAP